jgi:uncharacterized protein YjbI with pentapeptide repeats
MKVRQSLRWIIGGVLLLFCIGFVLATYRFGWSSTGFLNKSLWDWLQLLIIPVVLAIAGFWLNQMQKSREEKVTEQRTESERKAAQQRAEIEREIALDNQQEIALQSYLDRMSESILKEGLYNSKPLEKIRKIARVRTLTILRSLDPARKANVLLFLYELGLIHKDIHDGVISLEGADFSQMDLSIANLHDDPLEGPTRVSTRWMRMHSFYVDLQKVKLSRVNLKGAKLSGTDLKDADLSEAYLSKADLQGADLEGANLHQARLRYAILQDAILTNADLSGAYLRYVVLKNAKLEGANLSGADLRNANLEGATLTTEQLDTVKSLEEAIMPDGSRHF